MSTPIKPKAGKAAGPYVVRDDDGRPLGTFEAPPGASDAAIAAYAADFKRKLLARRAERERRRVEPQGRQIKCSLCGEVVPFDTVQAHIQQDVRQREAASNEAEG